MRRFLFLVFAILVISARLPAQTGAVGNLTASSTNCLTTNSCLEVDIPPTSGGATLKLSGTFSATVQFEATADPLTVLPSAANWVAISVTPSNSSTTATSATSAGAWQVNVAAYKRIRIRVSTYASGTVAAAINLSTASARGGSGGGGGGMIGGSIAANQVAFGSAANTIAGSNNLQYLNPGGSCGLTAEAAMTLCGNGGGGTTFGSLPSLSESISQNDQAWNIVYSNASGTGNTGSTRSTYMAQGMSDPAHGDEFDMNLFYNGAIQSFIAFGGSQIGRPSGVSGGLNFDGNGRVEIGVNNTDLTQTEWNVVPNGDMQLITETGKGLCIQGTTSGQGCLSVDATSTTMTETLPFAIASDGVHPGSISLPCNTTLPALASNAVTLLGCPAASNTAWSFQMATAIPTTNHLLSCVVTGTNCLLTDSGITPTANSNAFTYSAAGTASAAGLTVSGAPYTGGSATTNFPQFYINSGASGPTDWSTSGTMFGINAPSGFSGNLMALHINGGSDIWHVNSSGSMLTQNLTIAVAEYNGGTGNIFFSATNPTIASGGCGGTNSSITNANGTASFEILIGSGGATAAGCTITMPAAAHSWTCSANTVAATTTSNALAKQTGAISTTSVVIQNFSDVSVATAFGTSDTIRVMCAAN